ncbi:rCG64373, partial [Rattus norvegicus]
MALRYPMTVGPNKGHRVTKKVSKPRHSQNLRTPHQAHQVRAGHDPGSVQLRALRAAHHAQIVQGQACTQVHQEHSGHAHVRQEKAGRAEQCAGSHEEGGSQ